MARFKEEGRFLTAKRFCDDKDEKRLANELNHRQLIYCN